MKGYAVDLGRRLRRSAVVVVSSDGRGDEVYPMAAAAEAFESFKEGRCAPLAREGPDFQGADHQDAQGATPSRDIRSSVRGLVPTITRRLLANLRKAASLKPGRQSSYDTVHACLPAGRYSG